MASSYTGNSGIEKPAEGDQTGEWGDTVNTNMDIIDRSINGVGAITLSGTTHTLTTTDGTLSDGMYKVLVLGGSPSGTNTITIAPNDADKVYIVVNGSGQTATFTQGSGANVSVLNGDSKIIYADGAGSGAAIVDVTADLSFSSVNIDGGSIDGTPIGAASASTGAFTSLTVGDAAISEAELEMLDGITAGTVAASKAVVVDANKDIASFRNITLTGELDAATGDFSGAANFGGNLVVGSGRGDANEGGQIDLAGGSSYTGYDKFIDLYQEDLRFLAVSTYTAKFFATGGSQVANMSVTGEIAAATLDISGDVDVDGTLETDALSIASTTVTATAAELNYLDITTLGTSQASKAVTTDANGDVIFPDGDKIQLGTGSDLTIQHDGSNAYFQNTTGSINLQAKSGESSVVAVPDGAVSLYHNNAAKLATAATGITITGEATATGFTGTLDGILGSGAAAAASVTTLTTSGIASIDDTTDTTSGTTGSIHTDGGVGVAKALYVGTTAKIIGVTTHGGNVVSDTDSTDDLGTTGVRWANLFVDGITATDQITATGFTGTLDGILGSGAAAAATTTTLNTSGAVVHNDAGADVDFRVEGDTDPHLIFADGGNDRVAIGGADTSLFNGAGTNAKLVVVGSSNNTNIVQNGNAALAIVNTDQTDENTAGLHFARADTDDTPNYAGASIVAQFKETQATGQYPSSTLNFLTSTSQNSAPSLKMTLSEAGRLGVGTATLNSNQMVIEGGVAGTHGSSLALKTGGGANSRVADLAFYGTFVTPDNDTGQRRTADITSGFSAANWGNEFLAFGVGTGGGNDAAALTTERLRITGAGNVGIGSANALDNLHVFDTANSAIATQLLLQNQGAGSNTAGIAFQVSSSGEVASTTYAPKAGILFERTTANGRGPIKFMVDNAADNNGFAAGDEVMRIAVDGKVGIGTTAPAAQLEIDGGGSTATYLMTNDATAAASGGGLNLSIDNSLDGFLNNAKAGAIKFGTSNAERMRITSDGNLIVAGTSFNANGSVCIGPIGTSPNGCTAVSASTSATNIWRFYNPNGQVGGISISGSATTFATSSDYRLKENVNYTFDATTRIKQLKPARFNFISDDTNTLVDGFIAHEVSSVAPEAVTGTKDAVDENGDAVYQGIDQSKLVPLLVKTIQELEARITALEAG